MTEDPILEKAKRILAKKERDKICFEARICHMCGEKLSTDQDSHSTSYKCPTHGIITVRVF